MSRRHNFQPTASGLALGLLLTTSSYIVLCSAQHVGVQHHRDICDGVAACSSAGPPLGTTASSEGPKPNTWAWLRQLQEEERAAENAKKGIHVGTDSRLTVTQHTNAIAASAPAAAKDGIASLKAQDSSAFWAHQSSLEHAHASSRKRGLVGLPSAAFLSGLLIGFVVGISTGVAWARRSNLFSASPPPVGPTSSEAAKRPSGDAASPTLPDDVVAKVETIPKTATNTAVNGAPPAERGCARAEYSEGSSTWNCGKCDDGIGEVSTSNPCDPSPITKLTVRVAAPADSGAVVEGSSDNMTASACGPSASSSAAVQPSVVAPADSDVKTPWRQRPAPLDVAATPVGAASGGQTPLPAQTSCTTPSSWRRSPLASPTEGIISAAASLLAMLAGRADRPADRATLTEFAAELRQRQHLDPRRRRTVTSDEGTTPAPIMRIPTQDKADEPPTIHASKPPLAPAGSALGYAGRSAGAAPSSSAVSRSPGDGDHGWLQLQQPGALGPVACSSALQGQFRLATLAEEAEACSHQHYAMMQRGMAGDPQLQQQAILTALDIAHMFCGAVGVVYRAASEITSAITAGTTAIKELTAVVANFAADMRDNTRVMRAITLQRDLKAQRLAVQAAMTRGMWVSLIAIVFGSWMWGRWEEVSRRCAVEPGHWMPRTAAAAAAPGFKFLFSPVWWFSRALGLPTAQSFRGSSHGAMLGLLHWPYVSWALCHVHELGLWCVGCLVLLYLLVPVLRWAASIATPHSWMLDIPFTFGILCAAPGCIAVSFLGGSWAVWLVSWWLWCAAGFGLHVRYLRYTLSHMAALLMLMFVAPALMGVLPYAAWLRPMHYVMEEWAVFLLRQGMRSLGKRSEEEIEAFLAGEGFLL
ncbi:hypothetical protein Agub_g5862 [Astrephomene gubernaculifera]|uniref:Uncharacterized protein n=1 Tax=Astrephomene gubernaculifera TaxID=47775 RepID=A0AAD3HLC3_9CHLO|nr:hypothetical protein Agub_g5862 [Astrephomene gubernaculifera]